MSLPPVEIPLGAMRFNSDSQKLEYFNGDVWMQVHTFNPDLNGGVRGVCLGGNTPGGTPNNTIDYITLSTAGNATNFGDLISPIQQNAAFSSRTRGVSAGGENPSLTDVIDYITISSTGDATDFGNLTSDLRSVSGQGFGNQTRGIVVGGIDPSVTTTIQYVTIASTGNAVDSGGDLSEQMTYGGCAASPTRGIIGWGDGSGSPGRKNLIEYVTIASLGNSQTFGELSVPDVAGNTAASNSTRAIWFGGQLYPVSHNVIQYVTIATTGNAQEFGDLTSSRFNTQATASPTRGVVMGGGIPSPWGVQTNIIEYVEILTLGDSVDFGDLTVARNYGGGCSNGHGGL